MRLRWLVICAFAFLGNTFPMPGPGRAPSGPSPVNMFILGPRSEPNPAFSTDNLQYNSIADNAGFAQTEDEWFEIVPIAGSVCNLRLSLWNNIETLDEADDDPVINIESCPGGDMTSCTWGIEIGVTTVADDGTTDLILGTNSGCGAVSAGDALHAEWDMGTVTCPDTLHCWNSNEHIETTFEFRGTAPGKSFLWGTTERTQGFNNEQPYWFLLGAPTSAALTNRASDFPYMVVPGSGFVVQDFFAALEATPGGNTRLVLCRNDGTGDDIDCGGTNQGTAIAECTVTTSNRTCNATGLSVSLSQGDQLFLASSRWDPGMRRSVGIGLYHPQARWISVLAGATHAGRLSSNTSEAFGNFAGRISRICNAAVREDQQCRLNVPRGFTIAGMQGIASAAIAGGTFNVGVNEGGTVGMNCSFSVASSTCSTSAGDGVIDNDDWIDFLSESPGANTTPGTLWSVSLLMESLP